MEGSLVVAVTGLMGLLFALAYWFRNKYRTPDSSSLLEPNPPAMTVVLHQYGHAPFVPSVSPFVIKLETFLRVAKLPYVNRYDRKPGPKGKLPWIQYQQSIVADSQLVIHWLNAECGLDLNRKLTKEQKAVGHLVQRMVDEWLYWILLVYRLSLGPTGRLFGLLGLPWLVVAYLRQSARAGLWSQGIGRHAPHEIKAMFREDLVCLQTVLGGKKFLFGDSPDDVTEFDCALFGQLSQLCWQMPGCGTEELIREEFPDLLSYCQRMKDAFWTDWNDRLLKVDRKTDKQTDE